jgi:glutathione synthase/RimK-type ligase-like ATP-grasp enzyme
MPQKNTVLIISHSSDLHADMMPPLLAARGVRSFRLDLDCFPRDYQLNQCYVNGKLHGWLRHLSSGASVALGAIGAIWNRKPGEFSFLSELSPQERAYAQQESEQALFGLLYVLDCFWMSHPTALRGANWKGEQLQRALCHGFRVPASIVTNDPADARAFLAALPGAGIFKSLSSPLLGADKVADGERIVDGLATTLVTPEMRDCLDAVGELACHFQEYIPKQYELRVTVIGAHVFAARIDSQDDERTRVDCRDMSAAVRYSAIVLPADIEQRCRAFVHSYGLSFGALDLVVTPDGEYVFLENNPCGQFLFIEQLVPELRLFDAVADLLSKECACRLQPNSQH